MPHVESQAPGTPANAIEQARTVINIALVNHIKGKNAEERIQRAADDVVGVIAHMLTIREVRDKGTGATVMTESASMNPSAGNKPRNI